MRREARTIEREAGDADDCKGERRNLLWRHRAAVEELDDGHQYQEDSQHDRTLARRARLQLHRLAAIAERQVKAQLKRQPPVALAQAREQQQRQQRERREVEANCADDRRRKVRLIQQVLDTLWGGG